MGFLVTSGCLLSRKVWWVVWIGSFWPKLRYFKNQNGPHQNEFWLFSNTKMNIKNRVGKADEKMGSLSSFRSSHSEVFLRKGVLKICHKFTGEHPFWSVISIKLQSNFIESPLWHGFSPLHVLRIFRTPFPRNTFGWLLL